MSYQSMENCRPVARLDDEAGRHRVGFLGFRAGLPIAVVVIWTVRGCRPGTAGRSTAAAAALDVEPLVEGRLAHVARYRGAKPQELRDLQVEAGLLRMMPPLVE